MRPKAKQAYTKFDPEGSSFDERTAQEVMRTVMPPIKIAAPKKYQGDVIEEPNSFEAWVWHKDLDKYKKHGGSLDPRTGMVLKGRKHETWHLMEQEEIKRGNMIIKRKDGRYYSVPRPIELFSPRSHG